jgi:hypothetical protein
MRFPDRRTASSQQRRIHLPRSPPPMPNTSSGPDVSGTAGAGLRGLIALAALATFTYWSRRAPIVVMPPTSGWKPASSWRGTSPFAA